MENFVNVAVPADLVTEVYGLIARLSKKPGEDEPTDGEEIIGEFEEWSAAELRQLHNCPLASVQRVAHVLDLLSKTPEVPIALSDLATAMDLQRSELSGAFSGFGRWVKKTWPDDSAWPMAFVWAPAKVEGLKSETYYSVTSTTAEVWTEIRK